MTADKWTDLELEKLEKRITKEYKEAEKELHEKAQDYFKEYQDRWDKEHEAYLNGYYTDQQWEAWQIAQLGRGKHWEELRDQMTDRLNHSAQIAQDYVNGKLPAIYVQNNNSVAQIAQESAMEQGITGVRFDLVDEYTVKRLMEGSREVRPYKPIAIDLPKTSMYNYTKLQNALLQGILQGDSIDHIADRFMKVSDMNRVSAIRNARTAVTGAQNAGKQDRYEDLASKGCDTFKMWIATNDARTRDEHMEAWQEYGSKDTAIPYDEPFDVGGEELMYPADPNGSGWNIYNCRCTTRATFKFRSILSDETRERANIRLLDDMPVNEANTEPQSASVSRQAIEDNTKKLQQVMDSKSYEEYIDLVEKSDVMAQAYADHGDEIRAIMKGSGSYSPALNTIKYDYTQQRYIDNGMSKYDTLGHEYGHFFDTKYTEGLSYKEVDLINEKCKIGSGTIERISKSASSSDEFLEAIRKDQELYEGRILEVCKEIKMLDTTAGIQDFFDGSFGKSADVRWQHGDSYYNRFYTKKIKTFGTQNGLKEAYNELGIKCTNQAQAKKLSRVYETASEAWANISTAETCGGETLEKVKDYMPNSYDQFIKIMGGK